MTNFEKEIESKRGMTREEFTKILKKSYGDGKNIYKYTYGDVSSFLAWNKDKNKKVIKLKKNKLTKGANINDGEIYNWDQEELKIITTGIVFVGLNMSADGKPLPSKYEGRKGYEWILAKDFWFQNARRHEAIIRTFAGTKAEGAYFTDIIKPDKRIHDELKKAGKKNADSSQVKKIIKSNSDILKDHLLLFKKELGDIGADKPLLIVFGDVAEWCLKQGFENGILDKNRFHEDTMVKIYHYAYYSRIEDRFEGYRNDTRKKLLGYIEIPKKNKAID